MHHIYLYRAVLTPPWQKRKALLCSAVLVYECILYLGPWPLHGLLCLKLTSLSNSVVLAYSTPPTRRSPPDVTALVCKYLFTGACYLGFCNFDKYLLNSV